MNRTLAFILLLFVSAHSFSQTEVTFSVEKSKPVPVKRKSKSFILPPYQRDAAKNIFTLDTSLVSGDTLILKSDKFLIKEFTMGAVITAGSFKAEGKDGVLNDDIFQMMRSAGSINSWNTAKSPFEQQTKQPLLLFLNISKLIDSKGKITNVNMTYRLKCLQYD